jgi:hypothetical protein
MDRLHGSHALAALLYPPQSSYACDHVDFSGVAQICVLAPDPQQMAQISPAAALSICLLNALALSPAEAFAGEGPVLWSASGSASNMAIRSGFALDMPGRPRFGAESTLRVSTRTDSGTVRPPLRLWGEVDIRRSDVSPTSLGLAIDPSNGAARAAIRQSRAILDQGPATLSLQRTLEAGRRTDGSAAFVARQDVRLAFAEFDAAVSGGVVMDNKAPFRAELGLEKRLALGVSLTAILSDLAHEPAARIDARFERKW